MATTQRRRNPERPPPAGEHLARGFDYLTLNPAPRLRKIREQQMRHDPFREAWRIVGEAIVEAIRTVAKTTKSTTR
jgi:hypothetical protein